MVNNLQEAEQRHAITGNGSFRPRVVSALSRFGPESFRPGTFWPGSIRPRVVSVQFSGSFRPIFSSEDICRPSVCQHFQTTSPLKP